MRQGNGSEAAAGNSNAPLKLQTGPPQPTPGPARKLKRLHSNKKSKGKRKYTPEINSDSNIVNTAAKKINTLEIDSNLPGGERNASTGTRGTGSDANGYGDGESVKKLMPNMSLNSMHHGSLEDAIVDLEEMISRIKWIKQILEGGMASANASGSSWKFLEHRPSSTPK